MTLTSVQCFGLRFWNRFDYFEAGRRRFWTGGEIERRRLQVGVWLRPSGAPQNDKTKQGSQSHPHKKHNGHNEAKTANHVPPQDCPIQVPKSEPKWLIVSGLLFNTDTTDSNRSRPLPVQAMSNIKTQFAAAKITSNRFGVQAADAAS